MPGTQRPLAVARGFVDDRSMICPAFPFPRWLRLRGNNAATGSKRETGLCTHGKLVSKSSTPSTTGVAVGSHPAILTIGVPQHSWGIPCQMGLLA